MTQKETLRVTEKSRELKQKTRQFKIATLGFILIFALLSSNTAFAAKSLTIKEKETYKKCLENYITKTDWPEWWTSYVTNTTDTAECTQFALADINGDNKKELLVYSCAGLDWQWFAAYKSDGKSLKIKYYKNKKLKTKSTKSSQYSILTRVEKVSNKAFVDIYEGHGGISVKTYYSTKNGNIVEVAHSSEHYDGIKNKTIKEYYVKGKKTTKKKFNKKVKTLGKFKSIKYYNYADADKYLG